jgi:transposase
MSKTTNKFSPEVRTRAVRMVLEHGGKYPSRWAAVVSVSQKIGCSAHTLHDWVKKAEVASGSRAGVPSEVAEKLKALSERTGSCARPTRSCARPQSRCPKQDSRPPCRRCSTTAASAPSL